MELSCLVTYCLNVRNLDIIIINIYYNIVILYKICTPELHWYYSYYC